MEVVALLILGIATWSVFFRKSPPSPAPPPKLYPTQDPDINGTIDVVSEAGTQANLSKGITPPIHDRMAAASPRAGLPIERSYTLADGEGRARLHPIKVEIAIDYADYEGEVTSRTVGARSVLVTSQQGYVYLFGYCHLRNDERCFRVDRIIQVRTKDCRIRDRTFIKAYFL